tara:strand:- start:62217 stop:63044 length:828 start_codon:yes stop_codon:yes gene_type:complete
MTSLVSSLYFLRNHSIHKLERVDVEVLILKVLKVSRSYMYAHNPSLNLKQLEELDFLIKRRQRGEPVSYLTGTKSFWTLDLEVNSKVLIPRPETESLVQEILLNYNLKNKTFLDLGTGCGTIALAIASERPDWVIYANDYSFDALKIAYRNSNIHSLKINLVNSYWANSFKDNSFDVIASNPPYIKFNDDRLCSDGLSYEPRMALVSSEKGLSDIKQIVKNSFKKLKNQGTLYIEHSPELQREVSTLFQEKFVNVRTHKDLNGDERFTSGEKLDG